MSSELARNAYRQIEVTAANRLQLVVMLYDGAIRFLGDAKACLNKKNTRGKTIAINRALAILGELQSTLKLEEGGELAQSLDRLYSYMTSRILDSSLKEDTAGIDESIKLLRILNSAWAEIARKPEQAPAAAVPKRIAEGAANGSMELFG